MKFLSARFSLLVAVLLLLASVSFGQTASYAKRIWPVPALPATCNPANGDVVTLTGAGPVGTLYACTSLNAWSQVGLGANTQFIVAQGTLTGSFPWLNQTATWNNGAVTFTNYFSNVTDTASNAASLLFDQQVGGIDRFTMGKTGNLAISQGTITSSIPAFSQTATWNNAGVTFHNFVLNVVPTAFTSPSYLQEWQNNSVDAVMIDTTGAVHANSYTDNQTCASGASPAVCGAATAGFAVIASGSNAVVVNTTAVTANSEIIVTQDNTPGTAVSRTCTATGIGLMVTTRVANTSFTVGTLTGGNVAANYECFSFMIRN